MPEKAEKKKRSREEREREVVMLLRRTTTDRRRTEREEGRNGRGLKRRRGTLSNGCWHQAVYSAHLGIPSSNARPLPEPKIAARYSTDARENVAGYEFSKRLIREE